MQDSVTDLLLLEQLATRLGEELKHRKWLVATAESCTGGWAAEAITAIAGSSDWFDRGFVTYSNLAKEQMLGVPATTIAAHGAVSAETAAAMARGALVHSQAFITVSITGVAGPSGGSPAKPVGTVWFGFAVRSGSVLTRKRHFFGDRRAIRAQAVEFALDGLSVLTRHRLPEV
ncbi:MAG: nicotinamide-nucleotide amidase [Gammaproteobacteria bacterium]|nr:nicotinamide-nucleotide amidase [Gammaproteobacteria bacterium]